MQIQKHLFRIAERSLKGPNAKTCCTTIFTLFFFLSIYFIIVFTIGTFYILPTNSNLSQCFQKSINQPQSTFKMDLDSIYLVYSKQISQMRMRQAKQNNLTVAQNEFCTIVQGMNTHNYNQKPYQFSWTSNVLYLDSQQRQTYKFVNYTVVFKSTPTLRYFFYDKNTLLTNQLIYNPMNVFPNYTYIKSATVSISASGVTEIPLKDKIIRVLKSIAYYIVISIVTSLYIYGTIIAAPAVIIIFLRCSQFARNGGNMTQVYKIFPWIGIHSLIRQTSQNPLIKKNSGEICKAIILYFFFLYFVYYAIILEISSDLFYQKTEQGLEQMLFGYIALIQFCAIVLMRTRPFLKYFPATHTLLILTFLVYCQFVSFGLKKICLMIVCSASISLFAGMVVQLQIPAQNTWNKTKKYTPTAERPRIGFLPLFNMTWINNLPDEWTLLFPLFGRDNFSQRQLSFADRNFQELDQVFGINPPVQEQPINN